MVHIEGEDRNIAGIAFSAALGLGLGIVGGLFLREFAGRVNPAPMRNALSRLGGRDGVPKKHLDAVEDAVIRAWEDDPDLRPLALTVEALGDGIVEITGTASSQMTRQLAGDVARSVQGADVVLNHVNIEGNASDRSDLESVPEPG